jgi:hypothetical protein
MSGEFVAAMEDVLALYALPYDARYPTVCLYETFPPQQARRILARLEFHDTPKHGSWLNQAESEISIVERGCLSRPVGDTATLEQGVSALEAERNARRATIEWQFTSRHARVKLKELYPAVDDRRD